LCKAKIESSGDAARERGNGIAEQLLRIFGPNKLGHGFLHLDASGFPAYLLLWITGWFLLVGAASAGNRSFTALGALLQFVPILHWQAGKFLLPYIVFDSTPSRTRRRWLRWFVLQFLAYVLFSVALPDVIRMLPGR
jgi:hypothetical protein